MPFARSAAPAGGAVIGFTNAHRQHVCRLEATGDTTALDRAFAVLDARTSDRELRLVRA